MTIADEEMRRIKAQWVDWKNDAVLNAALPDCCDPNCFTWTGLEQLERSFIGYGYLRGTGLPDS